MTEMPDDTSTEPPNSWKCYQKRRNRAEISSVATHKRRERRKNPPSVGRVGNVRRHRRVPAVLTILRERLAQFGECLRVSGGHPFLVV
jgi:hypothetical protein